MYGAFTLEAILATAFGRRVDMQKGESDEFSKAFDTITAGFGDGQMEQFFLFNSKFIEHLSLYLYLMIGQF